MYNIGILNENQPSGLGGQGILRGRGTCHLFIYNTNSRPVSTLIAVLQIFNRGRSDLDTEADSSPDVFRRLFQASKLVPDSYFPGAVAYQFTIAAKKSSASAVRPNIHANQETSHHEVETMVHRDRRGSPKM